jgi:hypothetical protein
MHFLTGDSLANGKYLFEVGGKNKSKKQIVLKTPTFWPITLKSVLPKKFPFG